MEKAHDANLLSKIVDGVGHDLKSPLSTLTLCMDMTEMLMTEAKAINADNDSTFEQQKGMEARFMVELQKVIDMMEAARKNMHMIINRCVDFSKATSGMPLIPTIAAVPIFTAVETILENCRAQTDNGVPAIKLSWDHSVPKDLVMQTDCLWFEENLHCLLNNAIKYSLSKASPTTVTEIAPSQELTNVYKATFKRSGDGHNNSIEVHISLIKKQISEHSTRDPFLRVTVKDHGVGIPKDRRANLFSYTHIIENTTTIPTSQQSGGAGLGLYTLACRCSALGGNVTYSPNVELLVTTRFGEETGSIFTFELPVVYDPKYRCMPAAPVVRTPLTDDNTNNSNSPSISSRNERNREHSLSFVRGVSTACTPRHKNFMPGLSSSSSKDHIPTFASVPGLLPSISMDKSSTSGKQKSLFPSLTIAIDNNNNNSSSSSSSNAESVTVRPGSATNNSMTVLPPVAIVNSRQNSAMIAPEIPPPYRYSDRPLRILVVDDSVTIRKMASMVLSKAGHTVTVAAHGQEAVQLLMPVNESSCVPGAAFDVVLMDIQMPVMDGLTATSIYRQAEEKFDPNVILSKRKLLIIGMSACSDDAIASQAHEVGMDFFMPKPFSIHHFLAILQEVDDSTELHLQ